MTKFLPGRGSGGHSLVVTTLVGTGGGGRSCLGGHLLSLLLNPWSRVGRWHFHAKINVIVSRSSASGDGRRIETTTLGTDGLGMGGVGVGIDAGSDDGGVVDDGIHDGCF